MFLIIFLNILSKNSKQCFSCCCVFFGGGLGGGLIFYMSVHKEYTFSRCFIRYKNARSCIYDYLYPFINVDSGQYDIINEYCRHSGDR